MTLKSGIRSRGAAKLMIAGVGTITLDQRLGRVRVQSSRDALAGDWTAIGHDLRRAMKRVASEIEAA